MALADAPCRHDGHIGHRVGAAEKRHGAGGGVREPVGQQMNEFAELVGPRCAKAAGEVEHGVVGHPARQAVVQAVGQATAHTGLRAVASRAHGHVVAFTQLGEQAGNVGRVVLPVGVHEHQRLAKRGARAGFDGGAVAHAIRLADDPRARLLGHSGGGVGGAVVHYDDFGFWVERADASDRLPHSADFVAGGENDGQRSLWGQLRLCGKCIKARPDSLQISRHFFSPISSASTLRRCASLS